MTLVDRVISSLRTHHDRLAGLVPTLDEAALTSPSGATEWRVCDVYSHLGSGAEISLRPVAAAAAGTPPPAAANEEIWDRWNALGPLDQAAGFVEHDQRLVETLEALDGDARESLQVDLGFLPAPVPLVVAAGMRLNEVVLHAWDVEVAFDPDAGLDPEAAGLLLDLLAGPLSFLLGFSAKPGALGATAAVDAGRFGLHVAPDAVEVLEATPVAPTATFTGPHEALVRLLAGRLSPEHTPDGVAVTGEVSLDDLRLVFPGY
ncbi:maleylpyruvate isomerase family mycothiol-dependent enzyme [Nocardioides sp. C4-1]|uniref:maleylpyruvate isomerase family mycothiol-dependent enzyme n=1 Tax=Nocardioides sp. C4-1 TaxID=3151851 RepID=UPI0032642131